MPISWLSPSEMLCAYCGKRTSVPRVIAGTERLPAVLNQRQVAMLMALLAEQRRMRRILGDPLEPDPEITAELVPSFRSRSVIELPGSRHTEWTGDDGKFGKAKQEAYQEQRERRIADEFDDADEQALSDLAVPVPEVDEAQAEFESELAA